VVTKRHVAFPSNLDSPFARRCVYCLNLLDALTHVHSFRSPVCQCPALSMLDCFSTFLLFACPHSPLNTGRCHVRSFGLRIIPLQTSPLIHPPKFSALDVLTISRSAHRVAGSSPWLACTPTFCAAPAVEPPLSCLLADTVSRMIPHIRVPRFASVVVICLSTLYMLASLQARLWYKGPRSDFYKHFVQRCI